MPDQRRKHLRLPIEINTFIELVSPRIGQNDSGRVVTCKSLNASREGLQVAIEEELTVGAFLRIGVDLPDAEKTLYVVGQVRWCLPSKEEQDSWIAGFQLLKAENTDIDRWVELISTMED